MSRKNRKKVNNTFESAESDLVIADSESKERNRIGWLAGLKNYWWVVALIALFTLGTMGAGLKYLKEDARKQNSANKQSSTNDQQNQSWLNAVNPFVAASTPTPTPTPTPSLTPQLSKEYIYAGSRMLAVEDANATAAPPADLAVWRPSTGYWYVLGGPGSTQTFFQWGAGTDKTVPGDYDGDGKTDFSVFRPSTGYWYVSNSSNGNTIELNFGAGTDKPAQADYDGDGKTDMGVYRPSEGKWYIMQSSNQTIVSYTYGGPGDVPVPADYDGDGKADVAIWQDFSAKFYIRKSTTNYQVQMEIPFAFSNLGDKPVPGDYDGDGKADGAVWRKAAPYQYQWHVFYSSTQTTQAVSSLGDPDSDVAVQNDYDGDGKVDMAIWRPSTGMWHIRQSSNGLPREVQWGMNGDVPVPAYYRR